MLQHLPSIIHPRRQRGFTLLEMAIVLTIISLIIGGTLVGQSMIRASQLNAVTTEVARYTQAIIDFRDKYYALPGDFTGAEALWGLDTSCPNTPYTATPHTATCNGNGDGQIGSNPVSAPVMYEIYRAWQQLADAGMIDGAYTGIRGNVSLINSVLGVNTPTSQLPGAGYTLLYSNLPAASAGFWPAVGHVLYLGTVAPNSLTYNPALTPAEALAMDTKMDDGLPPYGQIITNQSALNPNCTTSDTASAALYKTANTKIACALVFKMPF